MSTLRRTPNDRFSGNGGLSLRRVSAIKRVLSFQERYNDTDPEDEWFGKRIYILPGAKVAAGEEGALAVEDVYMDNPMGFHVRDGGNQLSEAVWKSHEQRKKMFNYCPELSMIMDMKLERERCDGDDREGVLHPTPEEKEEEDKKMKQEEESRRQHEEDMRQEEEMRQKEENGRKMEEKTSQGKENKTNNEETAGEGAGTKGQGRRWRTKE